VNDRMLGEARAAGSAGCCFYRVLGFETIGHRPFTVGAMVCDAFVMSLALYSRASSG
jgi:hypothetical protein